MKHILVADNDTGVSALIARTLTGYSVTTATNGLEALVLGSTLPRCDLLITDYLMPALNGDELVGRLRQQRPAMKTLMLTGFGELVDPLGCRPDVTLPKPVRPALLRERVEDLIGAA